MAVETDDILAEEGSEIKKLTRIILIAFAALLILMGVGFYILWNKATPVDPQAEDAQNKSAAIENDKDLIRPVYSLETFIVNLFDRGGTRYLRTTMDLELNNKDTIAEIEQRLPQIRNTILMIIPTKSSDELTSFEGKMALRNEIMEKLNSFIRTGSVSNIYFTEFVIQ